MHLHLDTPRLLPGTRPTSTACISSVLCFAHIDRTQAEAPSQKAPASSTLALEAPKSAGHKPHTVLDVIDGLMARARPDVLPVDLRKRGGGSGGSGGGGGARGGSSSSSSSSSRGGSGGTGTSPKSNSNPKGVTTTGSAAGAGAAVYANGTSGGYALSISPWRMLGVTLGAAILVEHGYV